MCAKESNVISKHIENKEVHLHHERHHLIHPERRTGGIQPGRRKRFGKRHDHVIRDIAEIVKSFPKNGDTPLFFKTEYVHPQNHQKYPMYLMNRDGFSLLAMGFTGKEAAQ